MKRTMALMLTLLLLFSVLTAGSSAYAEENGTTEAVQDIDETAEEVVNEVPEVVPETTPDAVPDVSNDPVVISEEEDNDPAADDSSNPVEDTEMTQQEETIPEENAAEIVEDQPEIITADMPAEEVTETVEIPSEEETAETLLRNGIALYMQTGKETVTVWSDPQLVSVYGEIQGYGAKLYVTEIHELNYAKSIKVYMSVDGKPVAGYVNLDEMNPDSYREEDLCDGNITLDGHSLYEVSFLEITNEEPNAPAAEPETVFAVSLSVGLPEGVEVLYYGEPMIFTATVIGADSAEVVYTWLFSEDGGQNWITMENENGNTLQLISSPEVDNWKVTVHVEHSVMLNSSLAEEG